MAVAFPPGGRLRGLLGGRLGLCRGGLSCHRQHCAEKQRPREPAATQARRRGQGGGGRQGGAQDLGRTLARARRRWLLRVTFPLADDRSMTARWLERQAAARPRRCSTSGRPGARPASRSMPRAAPGRRRIPGWRCAGERRGLRLTDQPARAPRRLVLPHLHHRGGRSRRAARPTSSSTPSTGFSRRFRDRFGPERRNGRVHAPRTPRQPLPAPWLPASASA
jgi:hypothetical protein